MLPLLTHGIAVCLKDGYRHRVWLAMATTGCGSKSYEAHLAHHIAARAAETSHNYMGSTHTYAGSAQIQLRAARPTYEGKKLQDEPRRWKVGSKNNWPRTESAKGAVSVGGRQNWVQKRREDMPHRPRHGPETRKGQMNVELFDVRKS
jgi:hypothetical protein